MSNFMDGIKSTLNNECNVSVTENGALPARLSWISISLWHLSVAPASMTSLSASLRRSSRTS